MLAVFLLLLWDMIWNNKPSGTLLWFCVGWGAQNCSSRALLRLWPGPAWPADGGPVEGRFWGREVLQCYFREPMKLSRLYSVSYCCWSHSSPRPSSTDFMEAFPEVDGDWSPLSLFSPWNTFKRRTSQSNLLNLSYYFTRLPSQQDTIYKLVNWSYWIVWTYTFPTDNLLMEFAKQSIAYKSIRNSIFWDKRQFS